MGQAYPCIYVCVFVCVFVCMCVCVCVCVCIHCIHGCLVFYLMRCTAAVYVPIYAHQNLRLTAIVSYGCCRWDVGFGQVLRNESGMQLLWSLFTRRCIIHGAIS